MNVYQLNPPSQIVWSQLSLLIQDVKAATEQKHSKMSLLLALFLDDQARLAQIQHP